MNMRLVATVVLMASAGCAGTTGSAVPISGNRPAPTTIATDASTTSTTSLAATATTGVVSVVSTTVSPPGTTSPEVLSVDTVRNLSEAWRIEGISGTTSRPVLFEGTIYFGAYDGTLRAVDAETGRQLWTADVGTATLPGSPLDMDELVVLGDTAGLLHAVNRQTGTLLWSMRLDGHPHAALFGSPVLAATTSGDLVVQGVGSFEFRMPVERFTFRGSVVAVDPADGSIRWKTYTTDDDLWGAGVSVWSSPVVDPDRGLLFVGTGNTHSAPASPYADGVLALEVEDGSIAWMRQLTEDDVLVPESPRAGMDADVGATPNLFTAAGRDLVGVGDKTGRYVAIDRDDGTLSWSTKLTRGSRSGGVMGAAAVHKDELYVVSNVGQRGEVAAGPTAGLFVLDAITGEVRRSVEFPGRVYAPVTHRNGLVWIALTSGMVQARDSVHLAVLWEQRFPSLMAGGITTTDRWAYVPYGFWFGELPADPDGGLVAYRLG